ncbi:MAG: sulfotransferase family protein [Cyanobacteriota bacterium]|jgi:hypothetical protein
MTLPNFLIVGAAKSGTTALHSYLSQHPQIYMTPDKETNFFAFWGQALNFQGPGDEAINHFSVTELKTYEALFEGATRETALGEACPLYLYHAQAPERIYETLPDCKIIVILRDPVERAYANFLHLIRDGREPYPDFAQALAREPERIAQNWEWFWHYGQQGYYGQQLQHYYDRFPREQIRVYLYEDLRQNALGLIQTIFSFLGVDSSFSPDMTIRPNKSGMPKNKLLHGLLTRPNPLKSLLKPLFPAQLRQKIQHNNLTTPELAPEVRAELKARYREDILHCQALMGRDLSTWL